MAQDCILNHIIVVMDLLLMEIFQNIRPQIPEEVNLLWNGPVVRQEVMALTVMLEGFITEAKETVLMDGLNG